MTKGRRPGKPDTRLEILSAARIEFARNGYDGATIRSIASGAGVDPALVMHYFGSKERLFAASLDLPVNPAMVIRQVFEENQTGTGEAIVRTLLTVWDTDSGSQLVAALRSATAVEPVHEMVREFIHQSILRTIADSIEGEDSALRASLIGSQILGLLIGRYVLQFPELATASVDQLARSIGPGLDRYTKI